MPDLKFLLNSYLSGANAWFALGETQGHFAAEGLSIEYAQGSGAYRAPGQMMDGGFDLTFGDFCSLTSYTAERPGPAAIYAIHHRGPSAVAVVADGPIRSPQDLVGRSLLTHSFDVAYRSFPAYAQAAGIDRERVAIVFSDDSMAEMLQTMLAGGTEGVFGYVSSQKAVLRQIDPILAGRLRFLTFPEVVPDLYGSVMVASPAAQESKGDALRAFLRGLNRSLLAAVNDPEAAVEAVLTRNAALNRTIELERWRETIAGEMSHPEIATMGFGAADPIRIARGTGLLAETLGLARTAAASELFTDTFLPAKPDRLQLAEAVRAAPQRVTP